MLGATTVTTVLYLAVEGVGAARARTLVRSTLDLFEVAAVDRTVLLRALESSVEDFEDGVLHEAATVAGVDAIVSRATKGFAAAALPVFTPAALLAVVQGADAPGS